MKPYKHFRWLLMWLMGVFIPVFGLQGALFTALDKTDFWGPLAWSYATHALLTLGIGWGILRGHQKVPDLIGFLFMGGSLLKFAAYFLLFKPFVLAGLGDRGWSFFLFGIPYACALTLETIYVARLLGINQR